MTTPHLNGSKQRYELDDLSQSLKRWLRDTDSFTEVVSRWLQSPVDHVLKSQDDAAVDKEDAEILDMEPGGSVRFRQGVLQAALPGPPLVVAAVSSQVVQQRLSPVARKALSSGELSLGTVLSRYAMRRHTLSVSASDDIDDVGGQQVLQVRAALTVNGTVVALTDEVVYERLLLHRVPNHLLRRPLGTPGSMPG